MTTGGFSSYDGTRLAYDRLGDGPADAPPLVCLPGGPGRAPEYLGDLGGLDRHRTLVLLHGRGTGASAVPEDPESYRLDKLADDVEALRAHLGADRIDLLGHSAGAGVALHYAADHPDRLAHLLIVTGGLRVTDLPPEGLDEAQLARADEPWFPATVAAEEGYEKWFQRMSAADAAGEEPVPPLDPGVLAAWEAAFDPFLYARWDSAEQAHAASAGAQRSAAAADGFYRGYVPDPDALRARLATLDVPVLALAGELDLSPTPAAIAAVAALFPQGRTATVAGAAHFPWVDNPAGFVAAITSFLDG